ncbi:hypothetical protein ACGF3G_00685 [Streptomyces sp. NPDC048179]|uniref:hypothetical protein n=1 Tax=Streptomyces sp. NPDC048179 TaxID=3365506 RepID=UPI00371371D6
MTDTLDDDHPHRYRYFGSRAGARCVACNDPEPAPADAPPAVVRVTAAVLAGHHTADTRNEYGSCIASGFRVALGADDRARVHHQLRPADLTDPDRPSIHERWEEMRARVAAYAKTLEDDGFTVDCRERPTGPYLLATPAAPHCDCYAAAGRIGSRGHGTTTEHDPECHSITSADGASAGVGR